MTKDGHPTVEPCRHLVKTTDPAVNRHFTRLVDLYTYIVNKNELLAEKIQHKWFKHFQIYTVKQHQKLSAWNTLCTKLYLNVGIDRMNGLQHIIRQCGVDRVFASNIEVIELQKSFWPYTEFWTTFPAKSTFKTSFSNKLKNITVYHIDVAEGLSRNHDAWINNNDYVNFKGLFGDNCLIAILSADKCTGDGMQALGLFCESVCVVMGNKASSAYTSTIISCCYGGIKDTTETFTRLYQQKNLKKRMDAMLKRPVMMTVCLYNDQSRKVTSCVLCFDTASHATLNVNNAKNIAKEREIWDNKHELAMSNNNKTEITDLQFEIATELENLNTRATDVAGVYQLRPQRRSTKKVIKYQWHQEFIKIKQWLQNIQLPNEYLPTTGVQGEHLTDIDKLSNKVCSQAKNKPFLEDFHLNV